jgi:aspartyl aminopeptidase
VDAGQSNGKWSSYSNAADAINIGSAGGGIAIKEGANARMGVATLVAGTVTVPNTSVTANTRVITSRQAGGGTLGHLSATKVNGTSLTITSSNNADTSTVAWVLIEAAA